ncbi:sensor histidine kinase [Hymenobacter guriensis]|uniref:histidine kinase n=1 Tax=Hymenobacter guriensis TaxID=2793065 RepID=A0ABS0L8L3_9BACT|nr:PAS domain-containing sensor histidine kinase [Hymenobacter guriensis]MBG8556260.1 PAS domain S-box protein [Hymenobacter guriensis]
MLPTAHATALLEVLYARAPEFVGIYDLSAGWFTQVNPVGVKLLGYPSEKALLAVPLRTLRVLPWTEEQWQDLCEQTRRNGRHELEAELRGYAGNSFWSRIELTYFEADGQPFFLVRLAKQSRLQQTERELAHSVRRFEAVFANATIGIIVCDRPGTIVSANELSGKLFGYDVQELVGRSIDVLVPNAAGRNHQKLRESFNERPAVRGMGHNRDLLGQRKDGSVFPVEVSLSYFHLDQELYVVAYVLDITFKKVAEKELIAQRQYVERLNADLEQKVADRTHALLSTLEQLEQRGQELTQALAAEQELGELKSRFVSMASHEFRTPLTAVLTSATLIEKYPASEQQDKRLKHLQRIRASVNHLNDILEEFLSVGRIEEGRIVAHPTDLDLAALLLETATSVQGMLKNGQRIEQHLACPGSVRIDASLLRKILVNLLSNAIKYSGENSVVSLQADCRPGLLTLRVQDQGVGISKEDQEHLFERFFRARNAANVPGTGLGLYIIAKYLELMRGTISLQSELNAGTTVTITIPYEDHHPAD